MNYANPARSVALLNELVLLGLTDNTFALIHHFGSKEKIAYHLDYCRKLAARGGRFSSKTNADTQRRMEIVLRCFLAGGFEAAGDGVLEVLSRAALLEVPK